MISTLFVLFFFFFNDTATTEIYTLSLHDALPICRDVDTHVARGHVSLALGRHGGAHQRGRGAQRRRSEEHTSELQSLAYLVCRLLLEKKNKRRCDGDSGPQQGRRHRERHRIPYEA